MTESLPWLDADRILTAVGFTRAITALTEAITAGLDPVSAATRTVVPVASGELLLMPAATSESVGVKVATVAPDNPARGMPRIQALYLLIDAATLTPRVLLDGTALTTLRTPALSAVAASYLAAPEASRLLVFGSGPQAWGHVHALACVRPLTDITIVGRSSASAGVSEVVEKLRHEGFAARPGVPEDVADADIIVCATTARTPLFAETKVSARALVIAVGSHEPEAREVDAAFVHRAQTVVEDPATALREAGDIIQAIAERGPLTLIPLGSLVHGEATVDFSRPRFFKSVGMGWEDLVVAQACVRAS